MVARNTPRGPAQAVGWPTWKSHAVGPGFGPGHTVVVVVPGPARVHHMPISPDLCLACAYAGHAIGKPPRWLTLMTFVG
jgi:hypothetical protein